MRLDNWKIIYNYVTGEKELYDLAKDPFEHRNLASVNKKKLGQMSTLLGNLLRERGAQRPTLKATGLPAPWPDEL